MSAVMDALWRAMAYCLMPRVIGWSLLPLAVLMVGGSLLAWWLWEPGVAAVREALEGASALNWALQWLDTIGVPELRAVLAPLLLVALVVPVMVVVCLLTVTMAMMPALVGLVEARRFPALARDAGTNWVWGTLRGIGLALLALLTLVVSMPLWLVPPLVLIIPPVVWGWLAMEIMSFDVLSTHATPAERAQLMRQHRWALLGMGVFSGLLGAAPTWVWALGTLTLVLAPLVMVVSIWLYTAVFAFTALWFSHYLLAALQALRTAQRVVPPGGDVVDVEVRSCDSV